MPIERRRIEGRRSTDHGKHKSCKRYDAADQAHALTFSCFRSRPFLDRDRTRVWILESLDAARRSLSVHVWAYVIMPEHVHLLVYPTLSDYSISDFLLAVRRPVARRALRFVQQEAPSFLKHMRDEQPGGRVQHRFWQRGGGYDRNLIRDSTIHRTVEYIHANPVRRGLVDRSEQWRWSSAGYYMGERDVALVPDLEHLPPKTDFVR